MPITTIIFDFGGVFVDYKSFENIHKLTAKKLGLSASRISRFVQKASPKMISGKMTGHHWLKVLEKTFHTSPMQWKKAYLHAMNRRWKIRKDLFRTAQRLQKKYDTALLSNVGPMTAKYNKEKGWYAPFDHLILSCDVGYTKPDKKIYEIALRKIRKKPEECVFIYDHKSCLKTASKLGMHTILFQNTKQVKQELQKLGVLT